MTYAKHPSGLMLPVEAPPEARPDPPIVSDEAMAIINQGGQILLPFRAGDAQITFSRWTLAKLIDAALARARGAE